MTTNYINALAVSPSATGGSNLFACSSNLSGGGVFLSTNNGTSWNAINNGITPPTIRALAISKDGVNLFAGGGYVGIFLSTNNGTNWTAVNTGLTNNYVNALIFSGSNLFAGTNAGVFLTTNNGTSWSSVGLTSHRINALTISGTSLFAGTDSNAVFRRPLSDMITSVQMLSTDLPAKFILEQNYPNPFNPSTTISYSVPRSANVSLSIFNTLGQKVASLVNRREEEEYTR